jgi:hypothetical protein
MIPDDRLTAYIDGQLDEVARARVERELADDPQAAERARQLRAQAERLRAAYAGVLAEPVPDRLVAAVRAVGPPPDSLEQARARRAARAPARWALREWATVAAAVLVGAFVGQRLSTSPSGELLRPAPAGLLADGALATALTGQLASMPAGGTVQVGISYRAKGGELCRSFVVASSGGLAGAACHREGAWVIQALARPTTAPGSGEYKLAAGDMPPAVMRAIEEQMDGEPFDAAAEAAAQQRGWRP